MTGYDQAASLTFSVADTPFTSLTVSGSEMLSALDVTANTQLVSLDCSGNTALQSIDVSSLSVLQNLKLNGCDLQSLDVTHNTALTTLLCNDNSIPALDVRNCAALVTLECNTNALTSLNVTYNTLLQKLDVSSNSLQAVNVRSNPSLTWLDVSGNSAVNVLNVSNNPALTELRAAGLSISDIDLSANTALTYLDLSDNAGIAQLDLSANAALAKFVVEEGFHLRDVVITLSESRALCIQGCIIDVDLAMFEHSGKTFYISCEREDRSWSGSWLYWDGKGLHLPTRDEAKVIYAHKSELGAALKVAGYAYNYFQSSGWYWTSEQRTSSSYHYAINMGDGDFKSSKDSMYSFGVYVK